VRHDFNFATVGVPGLTLMNRYIKGDNVHRCRGRWQGMGTGTELAYVVQSGSFKDLS
jgi:hypothetical protein